MMHTASWRVFCATAVTALAGSALLAASAAAAPPLATVNPNAQTTVCLNNDQSSVNPGATDANGLVALGGQACTDPSASQSGQGSGASGSGSTGSTGSSTSSTSLQSSSTSSSSKRSSSSKTTAKSASTASIPAGTAAGIHFASIRYLRFPTAHRKQLLVRFTLRDNNHRLIRGAIVTVSGILGAKATLPLSRSAFTNKHGQVAFALPTTRKMAGHHFLIRINAHTPSAQVLRLGSPLLPKAA